MKQRSAITAIALTLFLIVPFPLSAQRGNVLIPAGSSVDVPRGASICADTIFANGQGHGTLTLANPSGLCASTVVVPVELISLSVSVSDNVVRLFWKTASETNNLGFEVQRSVETADWVSLAFVNGQGTSTRSWQYAYRDNLQDVPATAYMLRYRLKQIDFDGSVEYSPAVRVRIGGAAASALLQAPYPNPGGELLFIPFTLPRQSAVTIALYNTAGQAQLLVCESAVFPLGSHTVAARISTLPVGTYFVKISSGPWKQTRTVSVAR